jgi:hypothetical protein
MMSLLRKRKGVRVILSCGLIFLLILMAIPNVYAMIYTWNSDANINYNVTTVINQYWGTNGYWDVKGFQWGDPDTTYPTGFSYGWQNGVVSIWVADYEADWYPTWLQGTTVGTLRQGSVWESGTP